MRSSKTTKTFLLLAVILFTISCDKEDDDDNIGTYSLYDLNKNIVQINTTNFATGLETFYETELTDSLDRAKLCVDLFTPARFFDDQTGYFFAETFDAWCIIDAAKPEMTGTCRMDVQDAFGKYYVRDMVEVVKYAGYGFVEYYFDNPITGQPERKLSFVKNIPSAQWFIGSGFYGDQEKVYYDEMDFNRNIIKQATKAMATGIGGALANYCTDSTDGIDFCRKFVDHIRFFDNQSGYFFIYNFNCINIAFPTQKYYQGQDLSNYQDSRGNYVIRDLAAMTSTIGEGFYEYYWNNPVNSTEQKKISFAMKMPGIDYFIGAGFYLD
ncbi:MAG: cache domain-containing protein [Bacteroidales bacterium]|nr:cache domain-containing protein [Bacteroidales bacterium]